VLDSYFKFMNKGYLIHRRRYDLIRFFDHLAVAYFFGPPCILSEKLTDNLSAHHNTMITMKGY